MGLWDASGSQGRVSQAEFDVVVTGQSVLVRLNASNKSPRGRFYWAAFFVGLWIGALCLLVFADGKHGEPGMWHDFVTNPFVSADFMVPLAILIGVSALMVLVTWRYVLMAYPSDEIFHCDSSTLTISKVRWLDIYNKDWRTRAYRLSEISWMKYKAVARARSTAVYGLRFRASGRSERVLPGLGTNDAAKILRAVKSFGVNVDE